MLTTFRDEGGVASIIVSSPELFVRDELWSGEDECLIVLLKGGED